jgi:hypothetical protein
LNPFCCRGCSNAGELLKEMKKQKPGEYKRGHDVHVSPSLKDLGIEKTQSMRWQQNAESHGEE